MYNIKNPILTIGIPTYKRPNWLKVLLDSLVSQKQLQPYEWEVVIADNYSCDTTAAVVESFRDKIPNLRYFQNVENIGPDKNMWSLFERAHGEYVWILPDDDRIEGTDAIRCAIDKLCSAPQKVSFMITNASMIDLDSGKKLSEKFSPVFDDIFLADGRDILNVVTDLDLIGAQRLIIRRDSIKPEFSKKYCETSLLAPLALSLASCASGPAIIIGKSLAIYGAGDPTEWRVYWAKLCLQDMPEMLLDAQKSLDYSSEVIHKIIEGRKWVEINKNIVPHNLIFQRYGLSLRKLFKLYGKKYVSILLLKNIIKLFYDLPYRSYKKIIKLIIKQFK